MQSFRRTHLILAVTLLAALPVFARLRTSKIGDVAERARELVGKSVSVDGCTSGEPQGKMFQLGDPTGAISVLASSEAPVAGTCMEVNGVVRLVENAGVTRYMIEERERKVH